MNMRVKIGSAAVLSFCAACWVVAANAAPSEEWLTFTIENDSFTGSDNNYTIGLGISWVSADLESYDDDAFVSNGCDCGISCHSSWTEGVVRNNLG